MSREQKKTSSDTRPRCQKGTFWIPEEPYIDESEMPQRHPEVEDDTVKTLGSLEGGKGHGKKVLTIAGNDYYQRRSRTTVETVLAEQTGHTTWRRIKHGKATESFGPGMKKMSHVRLSERQRSARKKALSPPQEFFHVA